jgi:hypothetical protein
MLSATQCDTCMTMFENEVWYPALGWDGYEASDHGSVRSWLRQGGFVRSVPLVLKQEIGRDGYASVRLYPGGKKVMVHVLVLSSIAGPCPPGMECRHFPDRSRTANSAGNLSWGTRTENEADKRVHGTVARGDRHGRRTHPERTARGASINTAKLNESMVLFVFDELARGKSQREVARLAGVSQAQISRIALGKSWTHVTSRPRPCSAEQQELLDRFSSTCR